MKTWPLLLALLAPVAAGAGERLRLAPEAAWTLVFLAPAAMVEEVAHEGSHAAVGSALGLHVAAFEPWPQRYHGRVLWASVDFWEQESCWSRGQVFWVSAAPALMDLGILAATTVLLVMWRDAPAWVVGLTLAIRWAALADLVTFSLGWSRRGLGSDGDDARRALGWP